MRFANRTTTRAAAASGLTPGAHIHLGSCMSQGLVQYMPVDFTANSQGQINHETRTVPA